MRNNRIHGKEIFRETFMLFIRESRILLITIPYENELYPNRLSYSSEHRTSEKLERITPYENELSVNHSSYSSGYRGNEKGEIIVLTKTSCPRNIRVIHSRNELVRNRNNRLSGSFEWILRKRITQVVCYYWTIQVIPSNDDSSL